MLSVFVKFEVVSPALKGLIVTPSDMYSNDEVTLALVSVHHRLHLVDDIPVRSIDLSYLIHHVGEILLIGPMLPTIDKFLGGGASIESIEESIGKDPSQQLLILGIAQPLYQGLIIQRKLDVWIATKMVEVLDIPIPEQHIGLILGTYRPSYGVEI